MLNFQAKKLSECISDIYHSVEEALKQIKKFNYCAYIQKENVYPHLGIISANALSTKRLDFLIKHSHQGSMFFFKTTIQEEALNYTCFTIPLTHGNYQWIKDILGKKPHFYEIQDIFSDLIHDLTKQFLSEYQNAPSFKLFEEIMAYSQYQTQSKHLWDGEFEEDNYTQKLQNIILNDPLAVFFIQEKHHFILNDLLLEALQSIIQTNANEILLQYLERVHLEEPHSISKNTIQKDVPLCAIYIETRDYSIFSEFEFRIFNYLNQLYKNQLTNSDFKNRVQEDLQLKNLNFPRYEELMHLIHGENRWNITTENATVQPSNPYLDCWQSGLFLQTIHHEFNQRQFNKFNDPRLANHILYLPYHHFQILVLYFNCLRNPQLFNKLIQLIDEHLEHHHIQTIPSVIIDKIEGKYPQNARHYSNINHQFYETEVLPEIKHILLQQAQNNLRKMKEKHLHQVSIPVYDKRFHSFTMIRFDTQQPLSYLIEEILNLENPERFHAQWVLNKLKSEFNQPLHPVVIDEAIF